MPKYLVRISIALLVAIALYLGFRPQPVLVDTAEVTQGPMAVKVSDEGRWQVRDLYVISVPVTGHLLRVTVEPGDNVAAGDPVAWIAPGDPEALDARSRSQADAAVRSAEAELRLAQAQQEQSLSQLEHAQARARRARETAKKGTLSDADLETAEFDLRSAEAAVATSNAAVSMRKAQLDSAKAMLAPAPGTAAARSDPGVMTPIAAPVDGQVLRILAQSEQTIAAGTPILEFGNPAEMEVVTDLLSRDAIQVRTGAIAELTDMGTGARVKGRVRRVEPYGFTKLSALGVEEQRVRVRIDPDEQIPGVGHGYRADVAITVWQADKAVQLPLGALFRQDNHWAVFVTANGKAEQRQVTLGRRNDSVAEVLQGLQNGDVVITHPSERVVNGVSLKFREPESG